MFRKLLGRTKIRGVSTVDSTAFNDAKVTPQGGILTSQVGMIFDSFGRLKVGEPHTLFDNKNTTLRQENFWSELTNGVGASITHLTSESAVKLEVGTVSGEFAIRQSLQYHPYSPTKGHEATETVVMGPQKANLVSRVGNFDDNNGVFLERNENDERIVVRSDVEGSPSDALFATRDNWNLDKLDGTGPSGITINFDFSQILSSEIQWLGVGRVGVGFDFGLPTGPTCVHEFQNANVRDKVYMRTPNLPTRFEIRNVGTTASSSSMKELCCNVTSNGGFSVPGYGFSTTTGPGLTLVPNSRTPVLAIRLKNSLNSLDNRFIAQLMNFSLFASDKSIFYEVAHLHDPSAITGSFTSVGPTSAIEFSSNITAITGNPEHVTHSDVVPATTQGSKSSPSSGAGQAGLNDRHNFLVQNYDSSNSQVFMIYVTSLDAAGSNVIVGIDWQETE